MSKIERIKKIIGYGTVFITLYIISFASYTVSKKINITQKQISKEIIQNRSKDYESMIKNIPEGVKKIIICDKNNCKKIKKYIVKGKIDKGYLYIKASINNKPLDFLWDGIFIRISKDKSTEDVKKNIGGHLVLDESNLLSLSQEDKFSTFLYDLNSISYLSNLEAKNITRDRNFLEFINEHSPICINGDISSRKKNKILEEASIYYQCAENSDCDIRIGGNE